MREIKFRAWYETGKLMITIDKGNIYGYGKVGSLTELFRLADINNYKLMQYTGLKDKNGKEIYEGDIVKAFDENVEVVYGNADLTARNNNDIYPAFHFRPCRCEGVNDLQNAVMENECEVIGNIYENVKDLVEVLEEK